MTTPTRSRSEIDDSINAPDRSRCPRSGLWPISCGSTPTTRSRQPSASVEPASSFRRDSVMQIRARRPRMVSYRRDMTRVSVVPSLSLVFLAGCAKPPGEVDAGETHTDETASTSGDGDGDGDGEP